MIIWRSAFPVSSMAPVGVGVATALELVVDDGSAVLDATELDEGGALEELDDVEDACSCRMDVGDGDGVEEVFFVLWVVGLGGGSGFSVVVAGGGVVGLLAPPKSHSP